MFLANFIFAVSQLKIHELFTYYESPDVIVIEKKRIIW